MLKKKSLSLFALISALAVILISNAYAGKDLIGNAAPYFSVVSGSKETLTSDMLKGKIVVLFYEAKDSIEKNRRLKTALNVFYDKQPDEIKASIKRAGVIDCEGVIFKSAWEKGLRDSTRKEGITIYGDWDGKMGTAYGFDASGTNIVIIDKQGIVRYLSSVLADNKSIAEIEELLGKLAG